MSSPSRSRTLLRMATPSIGRLFGRKRLGAPSTEQIRPALDCYIREAGKKPGEFLFTA